MPDTGTDKSAKKPSKKVRIVEAFMEALALRPWRDVSLAGIAKAADVSLADLREAYPTRTAILIGFMAGVDAAVLRAVADDAEAGGAGSGEPPRERLFDVLMTRFEQLKPYRPALRRVTDRARRDPGFALRVGGQGLVSAAWMLEAAGMPSSGEEGRWRVAGLPYVWGRAFEVFLEDDDPGLARTMATLDRQLKKAEDRDAQIRGFRSRLRAALGCGTRRARRADPAGRDFAREEGLRRPHIQPRAGRFCHMSEGATSPGQPAARIAFEDFLKVDMRVGTVLEAEPFPEARKPALKLTIDFGPTIGVKRSSAQITKHYAAEDLIGTQVLAVVNFPPRQIGPMMSEVLTLGVPDAQGEVVLLRPTVDVPDGARLY